MEIKQKIVDFVSNKVTQYIQKGIAVLKNSSVDDIHLAFGTVQACVNVSIYTFMEMRKTYHTTDQSLKEEYIKIVSDAYDIHIKYNERKKDH